MTPSTTDKPVLDGELRAYPTLRTANEARQQEWDKGDKITLVYRACELGGEAGEALNICKKLERERLGIRGSRDTIEHLAEELADVVICTDLIAMHEGIDLDAAVAAKFNATSEKVGLSVRYEPSTKPLPEAGREGLKDAIVAALRSVDLEPKEGVSERAADAVQAALKAASPESSVEEDVRNAVIQECEDVIVRLGGMSTVVSRAALYEALNDLRNATPEQGGHYLSGENPERDHPTPDEIVAAGEARRAREGGREAVAWRPVLTRLLVHFGEPITRAQTEARDQARAILHCTSCGGHDGTYMSYSGGFAHRVPCPSCNPSGMMHLSSPPRSEEDIRKAVVEECLRQQPCTAEKPNEDAYQRGKFDGVMEFARNIRAALHSPADRSAS